MISMQHRPRSEKRFPGRGAIALAAIVFAFAVASRGTRAAEAARPRLVLALSVDQMRADYLTRFDSLFKGGFRRLLDQGAVFTNARYRHANTETGPGHSVILSGQLPHHSGIVANEWFDYALGRMVNVVEDPVQSPVGGQGRAASPAHFNGFTLGDALKKASPESKVVGVSMKDRSAILMAGRRADGAYWYEGAEGRFITSTYYMREAPSWLTTLNAGRLPDRYAGSTWERLLEPALYRKFAGEDDVKGEWDGQDTVFPHRLRGTPPSREFYDELRRTPFADELVLEYALAAMTGHGLGQDDATDVLAVSFSATDVIGHTYGPDSQEAMDQILRLDIVVGRLIDEVERRVGPGRTLIALSADHGSMPLVEILKARGVDARRVTATSLNDAVDSGLKERYPGVSGILAAKDPPNYYLDLAVLHRNGLRRADVESAIEKVLLGTGVVEAVYTHADFAGDAPKDDPFFALHEAAFYAPRSPQVVARLKPYVYVSDRPGGTGHGTPQDYDRQVPVVFLGSSLKAGRYPEASGPEDIAPTLATVLGLDYPREESSRLLKEMLK